jgi:hypothetical protein
MSLLRLFRYGSEEKVPEAMAARMAKRSKTSQSMEINWVDNSFNAPAQKSESPKVSHDLSPFNESKTTQIYGNFIDICKSWVINFAARKSNFYPTESWLNCPPALIDNL